MLLSMMISYLLLLLINYMVDQDEDVLLYYNQVDFLTVLVMFVINLLLVLLIIFFLMALVVDVLYFFDYLVRFWNRLYLKRKFLYIRNRNSLSQAKHYFVFFAVYSQIKQSTCLEAKHSHELFILDRIL